MTSVRQAACLVALAVALAGCASPSDQGGSTIGAGSSSSSFQLASPSFSNGTAIPARHACEGGEVSPPLSITGAPAGTVSLAMVMEDLSVMSDGRPLSHWVVWGIDPDAASFPEGDAPAGAVEGRNQVGKQGYLGPCPPKGAAAHTYRLTVFALGTTLDLPATTTARDLESAMQGHVLAQARLEGTFARPA